MTRAPLSVNLIARANQFGLSRDLQLLAAALRAQGHTVHFSTLGRGKLRKWSRPLRQRMRYAWQRLTRQPRHDINLMLENVRVEDLPFARCNLLVPNPEWCSPRDVALLPRIDGVLAKTAHAEAIFAARGCRTAHIGFTSTDRNDPSVTRERAFFHLAGRSAHKGTDTLLRLWQRHPEWPLLTVVQNPRAAHSRVSAANIAHRIDYVDDDELKRMQNAHAFHVCCSETEGFGHYIVEAMSVGALVLTTDAPPMHELVTPARGVLVAYTGTGTQRLATTYQVDEAALETAVLHCLAMDAAERETLGRHARMWFERNDADFAARLGAGIEALLAST